MPILLVANKRRRLLLWQTLTLDLDQQCLRAGDTVISASPAEFGLLRLFVTRRNIPMTKDAIMSALYGPDHARDRRQADFLVARLRQLLAPFGLSDAISTIAGRGYALVDAQHGIGPSTMTMPPVPHSLALAAA